MRGATLITACAMLAGCANIPHNNVLLFGTDTKVALDISSAATQGGAPQITIGYRRAEAVWMPLVANKQTCGNAGNCQTETATNNSGVQVLSGKDQQSGQGTDAYSVFASFGAKFGAEASGAEVSGSGGLAQFFATGIAAQRLAANQSVQEALKVSTAPEAAARTAEAEAVIEQERTRQIALRANTVRTGTDVIIACVAPGGAFDAAKRDQLFADASTIDPNISGLQPLVGASATVSALRSTLTTNFDIRAAMEKAAPTSSACQ